MRFDYFQMIDRVTQLDVTARTISAEADVPRESTVFEGHFPGHPLVPGVLLIESMAQASGWLLIAVLGFERMPFLAAVKEAKMRDFVEPGAALSLSANVLHEGSGFAMTEATVSSAGKRVCGATLMFRHMPFPNPQIREHMTTVAARIGMPAVKVAANG